MDVKKIFKKIIITVMLLILIISINSIVKANESEYIEIQSEVTKIESGESVAVNVLLHNQTKGISSITGYIKYDSTIFEELQSENIIVNVDEEKIDTILYNSSNGKISIFFTEDILDLNNFITINFKVRENIDIDTIQLTKFSIKGFELYCYEDDTLIEGLSAEKEVKFLSGVVINDLYLKSKIYKIGQNNEYEVDDKYISNITKETTKQSFIQNIETNGNVRIIKQDGTELGDNELVGTGMILEVTQGEEKIELKIAVSGDLSGDGKVTATDLSTVIKTMLDLIILEDEYKLAADLDENNKITATDLSTINKMLLNLL